MNLTELLNIQPKERNLRDRIILLPLCLQCCANKGLSKEHLEFLFKELEFIRQSQDRFNTYKKDIGHLFKLYVILNYSKCLIAGF